MATRRAVEVPPSNFRDLLADAPEGRHFSQLHNSLETLTDSVCAFVENGLRRGDRVIVIASSASTERYLKRVRESGLDPDARLQSGQLTVRDAGELLGRFMLGDMPQQAEFLATVGPLVTPVQRTEWKATRVYGEMANDLWRARHTAASIRLETYWNELARTHRFCLLCCYLTGDLDEASYARALEGIGPTHSDVLPTPD